MRFPIRYFTLQSRHFADALLSRKDTRFHVLRITGRVAIVWDRRGEA